MGEAFEIDPAAFLPEADDDEVDEAEAEAAVHEAGLGVPAPVDAGIAALERIEVELHDVDDALVRLDEGRYGTCAVCGARLADDELAESPTARRCKAHDPPPDERPPADGPR